MKRGKLGPQRRGTAGNRTKGSGSRAKGGKGTSPGEMQEGVNSGQLLLPGGGSLTQQRLGAATLTWHSKDHRVAFTSPL